jgi:hypothetical protein
MGAWGYGYRDNDNYYNAVGDFVEPLFDALRADIEHGVDLQDLRARILWTTNVLRATDEEVQLSPQNIEGLRICIEYIRKSAVDFASPEYLEAVESELSGIEGWLDSFKPMGFLEDRMGAIVEAGRGMKDES